MNFDALYDEDGDAIPNNTPVTVSVESVFVSATRNNPQVVLFSPTGNISTADSYRDAKMLETILSTSLPKDTLFMLATLLNSTVQIMTTVEKRRVDAEFSKIQEMISADFAKEEAEATEKKKPTNKKKPKPLPPEESEDMDSE
jgi:hypothetical protein